MMGLRTQRGIALITVMLVLAIATVAVVSMSTARQMDIRRTENQLRTIQAWETVYGLEAWAKATLRTDAKDKQAVASADHWSKPLPETELAGGTVSARIEDLQGRVNLNNLLVEGKASEEDVRRLKRLLGILEIKAELADAILDWIDDDMDIRYPFGAEDETYSRSKPPYRTGNRWFAEVSELLLVQGVTQDYYRRLLPYVYVADGYVPVNVNTASATVLRCLADGISADQGESIFRAGGKPFKKIDDFLEDEAVSDAGIRKYGLSVTSHHFMLSGQIDMGKIRWPFESQLQTNDDGAVQVVKRRHRSPEHG